MKLLIIFILIFLSCYSKEYLLPVGTYDWRHNYEYIYKKNLEHGYKLKLIDTTQVMEYGVVKVKERRIK